MPDQQDRDAVTLLLGLGWDHARIAAAIGSDDPETLEVARDRITADLALKLWEMAMAGSVAAVREFRQLLASMAEPEPEPTPKLKPRAAPAPRAVRRHPIGKKELALLEARAPDMGTPMGELMARRRELSN